MKAVKQNYKALGLSMASEEVSLCESCGMTDTISSNGDCGYCTDCYSVENYTTAYLNNKDEAIPEREIDWTGVHEEETEVVK